jgi:hypothetical protein
MSVFARSVDKVDKILAAVPELAREQAEELLLTILILADASQAAAESRCPLHRRCPRRRGPARPTASRHHRDRADLGTRALPGRGARLIAAQGSGGPSETGVGETHVGTDAGGGDPPAGRSVGTTLSEAHEPTQPRSSRTTGS